MNERAKLLYILWSFICILYILNYILVQDPLRSWGYSDWRIAIFIVFVVKVHYILQKKEMMESYIISELDNKWVIKCLRFSQVITGALSTDV